MKEISLPTERLLAQKNDFVCVRNRCPILSPFSLCVSHYTDSTIPAPINILILEENERKFYAKSSAPDHQSWSSSVCRPYRVLSEECLVPAAPTGACNVSAVTRLL
jgi:hypothetical protein